MSKYRRGDRLICLETEEYCVIHISGTDRQWVKFPDTHIGVYKNEQLAELFELLPKEIEPEQPAQQEPVAKYIGESCEGSLVQLYDDVQKGTELYTSPPAQRKPLTDEQIVAKALHLSGLGTRPDVIQFARAIEAAHGIKENT